MNILARVCRKTNATYAAQVAATEQARLLAAAQRTIDKYNKYAI